MLGQDKEPEEQIKYTVSNHPLMQSNVTREDLDTLMRIYTLGVL